MLTYPLLLQTVLFSYSYPSLFCLATVQFLSHTLMYLLVLACCWWMQTSSWDFQQFFLVRNVVMKLVVLASFFPTLLTSPVFLIMHLLLPLLRPCSNGNPRGGNVFVFLRPLCICIPGQHYACGRHPNSCIPHAVLVSLILVQHFTDLHAKVPATNGVLGSEGHIMLCTSLAFKRQTG